MSFTFTEPDTIDEAVRTLAEGGGETHLVAGGTGLTLLLRYGFLEPAGLVSLRRLADDLTGISAVGDSVRIGAATTLRDLERSPLIAERVPALAAAVRRVGNVRLRNAAQLGGAIGHGHPQMDLPATLVAAGARITVLGTHGPREIPADEVFLGYYETAIADDEIITAVDVRASPGAYRKVTLRSADDWPVLGVAVTHHGAGETVTGLRIAVGALAERPLRLTGVEEALEGTAPSAAAVAEAVQAGLEDLTVGDGVDASAEYRRHLLAVTVRRTLEGALLGTDSPASGGPR